MVPHEYGVRENIIRKRCILARILYLRVRVESCMVVLKGPVNSYVYQVHTTEQLRALCAVRVYLCNALSMAHTMILSYYSTLVLYRASFLLPLTNRVNQLCQQMNNLRESLATARANGVEVRGIAVINPGNPTGNVLAEEQIKDIIQVWL